MHYMVQKSKEKVQISFPHTCTFMSSSPCFLSINNKFKTFQSVNTSGSKKFLKILSA